MGLAGYETSLIGRMHFNGHDQRHGFENRPLGEYGATHPGAPRKGAPLFRKITAATTGQNRTAVEKAGRGYASYHVFDEKVAETTSSYLREHAAAPESRPFAAVAGFLLPHCPYVAHGDLFDYYYDRVDIPGHPETEPDAIRKFKKIRGLYPPIADERIRVARAAYFGMCEFLDRQIGRILSTLTETGLDRNTLIVYSSDHGEMAGEKGCWWKSNYFEGSVGVPMIFSLPGVIPEGLQSDQICNLMDLGPTLIDMAGSDPLPDTDGHSLWPILQGRTDDSLPDETFSEHYGQEKIPSRMIRTGRWKCYVYHDETPPVLYNLVNDPEENNDLACDPAFEDVRDRLVERLYQDWDPERVNRECAIQHRDMKVITAWGREIKPEHPDTVPVPVGGENLELR